MTGSNTQDQETQEPAVKITCELEPYQADAFAEFLKRVDYNSYRKHAASEEEAYAMLYAGEQIRKALADQGYSPR